MHSCSLLRRVSQRCDVPRAINHSDAASACESDASFLSQTHDIDKRRWGGSGEGTHTTTYTRPYSTYSSLLYLSSTGFTLDDHIADGIACFGGTGRSSS